jgi:hypothetical protein
VKETGEPVIATVPSSRCPFITTARLVALACMLVAIAGSVAHAEAVLLLPPSGD